MTMKLILTTVFVLALSGCAGVGAEATLKYDGEANGTHTETTKCDDQGSIKGSGQVPDGDVVVKLSDSDGTVLHTQEFSGDFTLAKKTVSGTSGTWTLTATRTGDDIVGDAFS